MFSPTAGVSKWWLGEGYAGGSSSAAVCKVVSHVNIYKTRTKQGLTVPFASPLWLESWDNQFTRILRSWTADLGDLSNYIKVRNYRFLQRPTEHTMEVTFENSKSPVTATVCTRNLSLHFESRGGSSFIAWSSTFHSDYQPCHFVSAKSTQVPTLDAHMLPGFYTAGVGSNAVTGHV